jgi:hypothetical protein
VRHVVVDGKVVVEHGSLTRLDELELAREVQGVSAAVMNRIRASGQLGSTLTSRYRGREKHEDNPLGS